MSTETSPDLNISAPTKTATDFELTPPTPVPHVAPEKAAGLVPVSTEQKSKLETKADAFVEDLISVDSNSPEFGAKRTALRASATSPLSSSGHCWC